jgi:hypothetical protein
MATQSEWPMVACPACGGGFAPRELTDDNGTCLACRGAGERPATWYEAGCPCPQCGRKGAEERYSLGIYAGRYCRACWQASGYRDEPASAFDPLDAGESYDGEGW